MKPILLVVLAASCLAPVAAGEQARGGGTRTNADQKQIEIKGGTIVQARYLALLIGASETTIGPGARVSLLVHVTPKPKMHIYAPGQDGYLTIAWSLQPDAAYRAQPILYPPSKPYEFVPLKETVRVYDEPFRLRQDITLATTADVRRRAAAKETLTLKASLTYQACDDAVCYRPETVPIEWRLTLIVPS